MKRSSVRLYVRPVVTVTACLIDRQQQRHAAGLLLRTRQAGDIDR